MHLVDAHSHAAPTPAQPWRLQNVLWQERHRIAQLTTPCSLGIHPWYPASDEENWPDAMRELLRQPQVRAVGEAGLDRIRSPMSWETQIEVLHLQVQLAEELGKPLIVHSVRSASDILQHHKAWRPQQTWVFHGFQESPEMAAALCQRGLCVSIGRALLDPRKPKLLDIVRQVPLAQLLIESDEHPEVLPQITQRAAAARALPVEELLVHLQANWRRLFGDA